MIVALLYCDSSTSSVEAKKNRHIHTLTFVNEKEAAGINLVINHPHCVAMKSTSLSYMSKPRELLVTS